METTTGMSAPPIGIIISPPSASAIRVMIQNRIGSWVTENTPTRMTSSAPSPRWIRCRAGRRIGLPLMRPSSLANAMTEPVKVNAPIAVPMLISMSACMWICSGVPIPKATGA